MVYVVYENDVTRLDASTTGWRVKEEKELTNSLSRSVHSNEKRQHARNRDT